MSEPQTQDVPIDITRQYWWLHIPFLSWIGLVFPVVLPPIPLGPVQFSVAWNRREWMSHIRRAMAHLGRERKQRTFPTGWLVNAWANLVDLLSLGLSHLFVTASLLDAMIKADGTDEERARLNPVASVALWLVLGNVVFLAVYIVCPGLVFRRLLARFERHLLRQYHVPEFGVTTLEEAADGSDDHPVLLFVEWRPVEQEKAARDLFTRTVTVLSADRAATGAETRWCNLDRSAPSVYYRLAADLARLGMAQRGWVLFLDGRPAGARPTSGLTGEMNPAAQAMLARQLLGRPETDKVLRHRVDSPEQLVTSLKDVVATSAQRPALLITFLAGAGQERVPWYGIRSELMPKIRGALNAADAAVFIANAHKKAGAAVRADLMALDPKLNARAAVLFRDGKIAASQPFGALSMWGSYVKAIHGWLGGPAGRDNATKPVKYHVADSTDEIHRIAADRRLLVVTTHGGDAGRLEFVNQILPNLCTPAKESDTALCWCNTDKRAPGAELVGGGFPDTGVALVYDRRVQATEPVEPGVGCAIDYVAMGRKLLERT